MTAHRHAELMKLYAEDATETSTPWKRWEYSHDGSKWNKLHSSPLWTVDYYRRIDPYRELKEAFKRDGVIQCQDDLGEYHDFYYPNWSLPADQYRIKPKKKKLWQWIVQKDPKIAPRLTQEFFDEEEAAEISEGYYLIQKAAWTEIELDR